MTDMTEAAKIIAEYEQHEARLGGPGMAKQAVEATAAALGVDVERVRETMLEHWVARG